MGERTILIVEDDAAIRTGLVDTLRLEGYRVLQAEEGGVALRLAREQDPDCIVLDLMLPDRSGFDVCQALRRDRARGAILILTAKSRDEDRVKGLDLGADDYLTKPFSLEELLARIRALLRRVKEKVAGPQEYHVGDLKLNFRNFEAIRNGQPLKLTAREFKILKLFLDNPGKVISRKEFLDKVWGYDFPPNTRTVDNHIARLRKRIEPDPAHPRYILSVRSVGYKFEP
ncbi:MAG: response regulator transcription factor [Planctomycetota bacterium]|nr:response regulator transcription factor [Planctomycetota bacterium]